MLMCLYLAGECRPCNIVVAKGTNSGETFDTKGNFAARISNDPSNLFVFSLFLSLSSIVDNSSFSQISSFSADFPPGGAVIALGWH